jgi:hypothetical protein
MLRRAACKTIGWNEFNPYLLPTSLLHIVLTTAAQGFRATATTASDRQPLLRAELTASDVAWDRCNATGYCYRQEKTAVGCSAFR